MQWTKFGDILPADYINKRCAIFRFKAMKFSVARLMSELKFVAEEAEFYWLTDYGHCHPADIDDRFILLPELRIKCDRVF